MSWAEPVASGRRTRRRPTDRLARRSGPADQGYQRSLRLARSSLPLLAPTRSAYFLLAVRTVEGEQTGRRRRPARVEAEAHRTTCGNHGVVFGVAGRDLLPPLTEIGLP